MQKGEVFLFRAAKQPEDPYDLALREARYKPHFIPALNFKFINSEALASALLDPSKYSGLIFTSQTAVQAVGVALSGSPEVSRPDTEGQQQLLGERWGNRPVFVVGKATSQAVCGLGLKPTGASAGNAEALSTAIIDYFSSSAASSSLQQQPLPLLFPCSSLRRETLPSTLRGAGLGLEELVSYSTEPHPDLAASISQHVVGELSGAAGGGDVGSRDSLCCGVFFSPSGVSFALRELLEQVDKTSIQIKLVAIGPTTADALTTAGHSPVAVAAKPTPESLLHAIAGISAKP